MATLTISLTGSAIVSGNKSYTINDADLQSLLDTVATYRQFVGTSQTNQQLMLAWVQTWIDRTKAEVYQFKTTAVIPSPISIS